MAKINSFSFSRIKRHWFVLCLFIFFIGTAFTLPEKEICNCTGEIKSSGSKSKSVAGLAGTVIDHPGGKAIKNATVCLKRNNEIIARTKSNKKGVFKFNNLSSGSVELSVCYENKTVAEIGGVELMIGKTIFLNVFLKGQDSKAE